MYRSRPVYSSEKSIQLTGMATTPIHLRSAQKTFAPRVDASISKSKSADHKHCPASRMTSGTAPGSGRSRQARSAAAVPIAMVASNIADKIVIENTDTEEISLFAIKRAGRVIPS